MRSRSVFAVRTSFDPLESLMVGLRGGFGGGSPEDEELGPTADVVDGLVEFPAVISNLVEQACRVTRFFLRGFAWRFDDAILPLG